MEVTTIGNEIYERENDREFHFHFPLTMEHLTDDMDKMQESSSFIAFSAFG